MHSDSTNLNLSPFGASPVRSAVFVLAVCEAMAFFGRDLIKVLRQFSAISSIACSSCTRELAVFHEDVHALGETQNLTRIDTI